MSSESEPVTLRSRTVTRPWRWVLGVLGATLVAGWVLVLGPWRDGVATSSWFLLGWNTLYLGALSLLHLRGWRIVLDDSGLLLTSPLHRTRRILWPDVAGVEGDVPGRLTWSTALHLRTRDGGTVRLPAVDLPLTEVHAMVEAHRAAHAQER